MAKKNSTQNYNVALYQPDELNALKDLVKEFISKVESIDNEVELLKQDRKDLVEEYSQKLDVRTLNAALRVIKIQNTVVHRDAYDLFIEALSDSSS
jgi:uncharacterized protein (UPF0335 family)